MFGVSKCFWIRVNQDAALMLLEDIVKIEDINPVYVDDSKTVTKIALMSIGVF